MSQQEALQAAEASGKVGLKAMIIDLIKPGGAVDLELAALANGNATLALILGAVSPVLKQVLQGIADKL